MKKLLTLALALTFALPAFAHTPSPFVAAVKDGTYDGTIHSVPWPNLEGKKAKMTVKHEGGKVVADVTFEGHAEKWHFDDKTLKQTEHELATGKLTKEYAATAQKPATATEQVYGVNCTDRAKNICEAEIDARATWTVKVTADGMSYSYTGVHKHQKGDPKVQPETKFDIQFTRVK